MKELLTYVARNLVDNPDQVSVNQYEGDGETVLELRVACRSPITVMASYR